MLDTRFSSVRISSFQGVTGYLRAGNMPYEAMRPWAEKG